MAINTTALVRERKQFLRELKPMLRKVDAAIEKSEREVVRIIARKRTLPEYKDLEAILKLCGTITNELAKVVAKLDRGYVQ